jgi:hypothetical protein
MKLIIYVVPVEARFSSPDQTGSGAHPAPSGVKATGGGVNHPPPSSAEVKEGVELYLYSPVCAFMQVIA